MKTRELFEMSYRSGDFSSIAASFGDKNKDRWFKSKVYANIDEFDVRKEGPYYSIWDSDQLIAFASLTSSDPAIVDDVWVHPEYRGKKLFSKLLWFFKSRENRSRLIIGEVHSSMMQEVIKGLKLFKKSLYRLRDHTSEDFDEEKLYGAGHWLLMLENSDQELENFPKSNGDGYIKENYDVWIELQ